MESNRLGYLSTLPLLAGAVLMIVWLAASAAFSQVSQRAEPVTGPDVTTIGGIAANARVNVRSGPAAVFPAVGSLGYGTRVRTGACFGGGSARWCQIETMDRQLSGFVSARYLVEGGARPPVDSLDGGPDFWAVRGLPRGERMNVRVEPSARSAALATLGEGEIVRNLGCRMNGDARWCRVRSTTGMDVTGWVAGRYLRESAAPQAGRPPGAGSGGSGQDSYVVSGVPAGDVLNVRSQASAQSAVIARLASGARVQNLGCQQRGQTRWCRIRTIGGVDVTGWVNGRYLRKG